MTNKNYLIDNKIYSEKIIKKWLEIFKENFNIEYIDWKIIINEVEENKEIIFLEFMNYLIYLENNDDWL